jgi:hypothetical protein
MKGIVQAAGPIECQLTGTHYQVTPPEYERHETFERLMVLLDAF